MKFLKQSIVTAGLFAYAVKANPILQLRSKIPQSGCSGDESAKIQEALASCADISLKAAQAADAGGALFQAFFKTTDAGTRQKVAGRFRAIAGECSARNSGKVNIHCTNADNPAGQGGCGGFTYGISFPGNIYLCPHFYVMPLAPESCNGFTNNRASALIHELTHRDEVFAPGTQDTYGIDQILQLDGPTALQMADTYSLFATYTVRGCKAPSSDNPFGDDTSTPEPAPPSNRPPKAAPTSNTPAPIVSSTSVAPGTVKTSSPSTDNRPNNSSQSPVCYDFINGKWNPRKAGDTAKVKASICYENANGKWTTKGVQTSDGSKW